LIASCCGCAWAIQSKRGDADLNAQQIQHPIESLEAVVKSKDLLKAIAEIREVYVSPAVQRYIIDWSGARVRAGCLSRREPARQPGVVRTGQARAACRPRSRPADDIKALAVPVLGHRIIVSPARACVS